MVSAGRRSARPTASARRRVRLRCRPGDGRLADRRRDTADDRLGRGFDRRRRRGGFADGFGDGSSTTAAPSTATGSARLHSRRFLDRRSGLDDGVFFDRGGALRGDGSARRAALRLPPPAAARPRRRAQQRRRRRRGGRDRRLMGRLLDLMGDEAERRRIEANGSPEQPVSDVICPVTTKPSASSAGPGVGERGSAARIRSDSRSTMSTRTARSPHRRKPAMRQSSAGAGGSTAKDVRPEAAKCSNRSTPS